MTPCEKWTNLISRILSEIEAIDEETEWSDYAPVWWFEMMSVERSLLNLKSYDPQKED